MTANEVLKSLNDASCIASAALKRAAENLEIIYQKALGNSKKTPPLIK